MTQAPVDARRLVDELWSYCNVLRDDGVSTIECTEQLTYLLFLTMAHERETRPLAPETIVPAQCSWQRLLDADGDELEITWLRDAALDDLPAPEVIAREIVDDLAAALAEFEAVAAALESAAESTSHG